MKRYFIYALLLFFIMLSGRMASAQKAGGPCSYKHIVYPAKVLEVFGDTSRVYANFEVIFDNNRRDTISYYVMTGKYITRKEANEKGVVAGAVFKYIEMHILTGACTPFIKRLTLDKFGE